MKLTCDKILRIAVFRVLQLGDLLCAIPAIRALRHAYPNAEITLISLPWAASLLKRFPLYFDHFLHFPGYEGLPEQPFNNSLFEAFLKQVRQEEFDLLIQMQGNGTIVNSLLHTFGAKYVAGFHNAASRVDSDLFLEYPNDGPEVERHLKLMTYLGIQPLGNYMEYPQTSEDAIEVEALGLPVKEKGYVCLHPGSRGAWRQWPPEYFAMMGDYCTKMGYQIVLTGTDFEAEITAKVRLCMQYPVIDLTGKTSLGAIGLIIRNAFMLIANCTGVSHIASATDTPSVILSMDGEPERWGPLNRKIHRVIDWTTTPELELVVKETHDLIVQQQELSGIEL